MITELPRTIQNLLVSQRVVDVSQHFIEHARTKHVECCLLWYGYVLDADTCVATSCVYPPQANHPTSYAIPVEAMRTVRQYVRPHKLLLLVQAHTHPRRAFFSEWDAANALNKRAGALNLVLPDYGDVHWIDQDRFCMVEMDDQNVWQPWSGEDWKRLRVIPDAAAPPIKL